MRYRNVLLATAACGAAFGVQSAEAAEPVKLGVGGFFREAYMVVVDDDEEGDLGFDRNTDGFFNDAEIHFTGSTVLDNGLEVGARVELEGETDGDQIDEAWVWFAGGLGEMRVGSEDEALANACVVPPGGTANFSAFSPNQWGSNGGNILFLTGVAGSNSICTGVDDSTDAQKLVYISPVFGGFQLTASYTPSAAHETHTDGAGPHLGMPANVPVDSRHNTSAYLTYAHEGADWSVTAGLGGSWEGAVETAGGLVGAAKQEFYQAGLNLGFGNFAIGLAGEYYNDARDLEIPGLLRIHVDSWVAGIGASYALDAWTFGLQYSHREDENTIDSVTLDDFDTTQDRIVATVNYALGPGINVDAELGYTWIDTDPEVESFAPAANSGLDDYGAFEIGIGTSIAF
jgi:predicted porin